MDDHDRPSCERSSLPAQAVAPPQRLELTRSPGVGPDATLLGNLRGALVIELGCGSGHNIAHLVAHTEAVGIGVDRDLATVRRARTLYGQLPGIRFQHADAASHLRGLPPGSVDVCLSIFGAFSFSDLRALLAASAVALRPGGLLLITLRADDRHDQLILLRRR
jgi:SAM-dependent methyltransferase